MRGKGLRFFFIALMLGLPLLVLFPRQTGRPIQNLQPVYDNTYSANLERYVADGFPIADQLRQIRVDLKRLGGQREYNGIFLSSEGLMKNIDPPIMATLTANVDAVADFAEYCSELDRTVFLVLIPSASGVLTQNLPLYSTTVNQRRVIEDIYGQLIGRVSTINAHTVLSDHRNQYVYYRTEDNLTSYGGYLVYGEMASRMLGTEAPELGQFNISYDMTGYYGDLYQSAPYRYVQPDILSTYHFSAFRREYLVSHTQTGDHRVYHTLYPRQALELGNPMKLYLGGQSAMVNIRTTVSNNRRLLIFGDKTALGYLPFLANHYQQITLIDLFHSENLYASVKPEDYNQILFAYGIESFTTTANPSRARILIREANT